MLPSTHRSFVGIVLAALGIPLLAASSRAADLHVPADFATIQQAIVAATNGDTILVAPGTYAEHVDFLGKGLQVIGTGGAALTTIDAGGTGSCVTAHSNEPAGTLLRGFTLRNGGGQNSATVPGQLTGGGLFAHETNTHLGVQDCTFTANVLPAGSAGAAAVEMGTADIQLTDCAITGNSAPGGSAVSAAVSGSLKASKLTGCNVSANTAARAVQGYVAMTDCIVSANTGNGFGIGDVFGGAAESAPPFSSCLFEGNGGRGAVIGTQFTALLANCTFRGNAQGGASVFSLGAFIFSGVRVENCVFIGDSVQTSFTSDSGFGAAAISNCTFDGGAVQMSGGSPKLFRGNIARNGTVFVGSIDVSHSDVQGGAPGTGNIDADPLWVNAAAFDYHLKPGSPCINTGSPLTPVDADGSPPDMGAFPYNPWTNIGGGVAGSSGPTLLQGVGSLLSGTTVTIVLSEAPPLQPVTLLIGFAQLGAPFKGGTLWPSLDFVIPAATDSIGKLTLFGSWPAGVPSVFSFYTQVWYSDATAPLHFAGSNGLRATTP